MTRLVQSSPQTDAYLADCDRLVTVRSATEPSWLRNLRRKGIEHFADAGFPTTRDEDWKFTSVAPIADRHFAPAHDGQRGLTTDLVESWARSEEHTSELQSQFHLVCRLLLEK